MKFIKGCQGKRGMETDHLFEALLATKPTSTSFEKVFYVASGVCTKIRNSPKINLNNLSCAFSF